MMKKLIGGNTMKGKRMLIGMIALMFICSAIPTLIGQEENMNTIKERKYKENRDIVPIYTKHGLENLASAKGKPGVYVTITNPKNGDTVSGSVTITINSNDNPTITIDGSTVGSGLSYVWDTTQYSDGSHTIAASARGHTDTIGVTVDNGGGGSNTAPTVVITNPTSGDTVSGTITITVDASDSEDGTLTADIYIDGSYIAHSNSYIWDTTSSSDSSHTILAQATDSGGLSDSDEISVTVNNGGGGGDGIIHKYALVIGISDYEGTANDLAYCDDDAQDWKNFLQGEGYTVTLLTDNQATADNIENELYDLITAEDADDYVVLTYSGHGYDYPGYGSCIISQDLYYMTHGYFESFFDTAESQHIYVTFDACEIGDFQGLVKTNRVGAFASNNRYSYDGDSSMKNGVFTYYQMEGWDIYSNFEEDAAYAVQHMKDWAPRFIKVDPFYVDQFAGAMIP
jgi:hypothetical protein